MEGLIEANARMMNKVAVPGLEGRLLRHYGETSGPHTELYWHLVSVSREIEHDPSSARAYRWLVEGLRWRIGWHANSADKNQ